MILHTDSVSAAEPSLASSLECTAYLYPDAIEAKCGSELGSVINPGIGAVPVLLDYTNVGNVLQTNFISALELSNC